MQTPSRQQIQDELLSAYMQRDHLKSQHDAMEQRIVALRNMLAGHGAASQATPETPPETTGEPSPPERKPPVHTEPA